MSGPKETVYDAAIAPLMTQILEICKAHNINMAAIFSLDLGTTGEPIYCTSGLVIDETDTKGFAHVYDCHRRMCRRYSIGEFMAWLQGPGRLP